METELPDIDGFSDFPKYLESDGFDEKIDDILHSADIDKIFENVTDFDQNTWNFISTTPLSSPLSGSIEGSQINPDDFLNDVDIDDSFAYSDGSSPLSHSPSSSDNAKHDSSSSDESSITIESPSPPTIHNYLPTTPAATVATPVFPLQNAPIRIFQGTLIPVSTIQIQATPTITTVGQPIVIGQGNILANNSRRKVVLPKPRASQNHLGLTQNITVDEKLLKKQQRMIKNRESASVSRNKKREYVMSLEVQVKSLLVENNVLKRENNNLKAQISNMVATCQCRVAQYSHFTKTITSQNRKNAALLLAMVFMLSMSFGNFGLLSSKPQSEINISGDDSSDHIGRNLLWTGDYPSLDDSDQSLKNISKGIKSAGCGLLLNQTENTRIETDLRQWIGVSDSINSTQDKFGEDAFNFMPGFDIFKTTFKNLYKSHRGYFKRKNPHLNHDWLELRKRRMTGQSASAKSQMEEFLMPPAASPSQQPGQRRNRRFTKLFKEIGRREDTFYVVSFSNDHLMLSAANHNASSRPRMSFVLPAEDPQQSGKVALMQIDCEVVNTTKIQLRKEFIPQHLRALNRTDGARNSTTGSYDVPNKNDLFEMATDSSAGRTNRKHDLKKIYKPYFIDKSNFAKADDGPNEFSDLFLT